MNRLMILAAAGTIALGAAGQQPDHWAATPQQWLLLQQQGEDRVAFPYREAGPLATAGVVGGGANVNGAQAGGFASRAALMEAPDNGASALGAADQAIRALELFPSAGEGEKAAFRLAVAEMANPSGRAVELFRGFLETYPASGLREIVKLRIADCLFDRGQWAEALKAYSEVNDAGLDEASGADWAYRRAYCLLKTADYADADALYSRLSSAARYANAARFYRGYIAYMKGDFREASQLFGKVNPRSGQPCSMTDYYLAQTAFMDGDYQQSLSTALALLRKPQPAPIAQGTSWKAETQRIAGESLYALGRQDEALPYLQQYVEEVAEPLPSALYILGVDDYRNGRYDEALERLTPVAQSGENAMAQSAYLFIGESYLQQGNYNAATIALEKASRYDFDPQVQQTAFYNYAVARSQGGRVPFGNSVSVFEDFLTRFPTSPKAPEVLEYVVNGYMDSDNPAAALAALDRVGATSPQAQASRQRVLYALGARELQGGQTAQALRHLREAASMGGVGSKDIATDAKLWEGECLYRLGEYADAVKAYNAFLNASSRKNQNRALAYYDLGYAQFAQKQFAASLQSFKKALETAGQRGQETAFDKAQMADIYNRMADCRYYAHDFAGADGDYERAYRENPRAGDYPMYQQGLMKGLRRDHEGKIATLVEMTKRFPNSALIPSALLEMGESYGELGRTQEAIVTYSDLCRTYPSTAQGRQGALLLAMSYLNTGRQEAAIKEYKRVIQSYPSSEEARAAADDLKEIYTDMGRVNDYVVFMRSVPNAPGIEVAEAAALSLRAVERAVDQSRDDDALSLARELIETYPDTPEAVRALGVKADIEFRRGDTETALATYQQLESRASQASDTNAARLGIMHAARDLGRNDLALETAEKLLSSSSLAAAEQTETEFVKAMALKDLDRPTEAVAIWERLAANPDDLNGAKSAYYLAQFHHDKGENDLALREVNALIEANPPHDYWLARGFILLSDIRRAQGNKYEADEYLRSLRENYPGDNAEILRMIEQRLKSE